MAHEADSNEVHTTSGDTTPRERILTLNELNKKGETNQVEESIAYVDPSPPIPAPVTGTSSTDTQTIQPQPQPQPMPISNKITDTSQKKE